MDKRNLRIKAKSTPIELLLAIIAAICLGLAIQSCSPTASLPNGCKYKIHAPKFNK